MVVAATGSYESVYLLTAFLLFLSGGMTLITRAPRSMKERAKIITELEPGKLYSGYFIYQPEPSPAQNSDQTESDDIKAA